MINVHVLVIWTQNIDRYEHSDTRKPLTLVYCLTLTLWLR
jgi:hypothetical protein